MSYERVCGKGYERICDVPAGVWIMVPWECRGIHKDTKKIKTFQFDMPYGAHPKYWDWWGGKDGYQYYEKVDKPLSEHSFRVLDN